MPSARASFCIKTSISTDEGKASGLQSADDLCLRFEETRCISTSRHRADTQENGHGNRLKQETFRDDFSYRNSPENIRRFPFPFDRDEYM